MPVSLGNGSVTLLAAQFLHAFQAFGLFGFEPFVLAEHLEGFGEPGGSFFGVVQGEVEFTQFLFDVTQARVAGDGAVLVQAELFGEGFFQATHASVAAGDGPAGDEDGVGVALGLVEG